MTTTNATAVLIHGAGTGAWVWDRVTEKLSLPALPVEMPLGEEGATPQWCADVVMKALSDHGGGAVIPVLHSWAGVLSGLLAERLGSRLSHVVYLSAVVPPANGSFVDALPIPQRWILRHLCSTNAQGMRPSDAMIRREYCDDLNPVDANTVIERFTPQRAEPLLTTVPAPSVEIPSTYITLSRDQSVPPSWQRRYLRRLTNPARAAVDAGHLAMLSRPDEVAAVIDGVVDDR
ncbi:MAG: alpha/beta hydrolase [Spirochaetaceae bacterium]|nr:MAG: alpha/beta hydrolase [Spirochaetaceae bacterium]